MKQSLTRTLNHSARAVIALLCLLPAAPLRAQQPRINALFPMGGRQGSRVEVEVRGAALQGANLLLCDRPGVSGTIAPGGEKPDETNRPVWQAKCGACHELRSPANRSMTADQWAATVQRMVKVNNAPLSAEETGKVIQYLQSAARAGRLLAQITIAPNAPAGTCELRLVTAKGVSTACPFDVGTLPEVTGGSGPIAGAPAVTLPVTANGCFAANGERHFYRFTGKKGTRYLLDMKAFRFNEASQLYMNPDIRLYDPQGREIAESHWGHLLDPLLDWTCPADGSYTAEARDLLGNGNPASVYRLTLRELAVGAPLPADPAPADRGIFTAVARPDTVSMRPGLSSAVQVIVTRRDGGEGDVTATVEGLPPGVSVTPAVIPPDRNDGWVVLTAAPGAAEWAGPVRVTAEGRAGGGVKRAEASAQELYRLGNDLRAVDRRQTALSLRGRPEFTASLETGGPLLVQPRQGVEVKVKIRREPDFKGPVTVRLDGLPSGWVANWETAGPDRDEVTLLVRPDGNNPRPFLKRDPKLSPMRAVAQAWGPDEFLFEAGSVPVAAAPGSLEALDAAGR